MPIFSYYNPNLLVHIDYIRVSLLCLQYALLAVYSYRSRGVIMPQLKISDSISIYDGNEHLDCWMEQLVQDIVMNMDSSELKELMDCLEMIYKSIVRTYH